MLVTRMFSTLSNSIMIFTLSSLDAFNLDQFTILLIHKESSVTTNWSTYKHFICFIWHANWLYNVQRTLYQAFQVLTNTRKTTFENIKGGKVKAPVTSILSFYPQQCVQPNQGQISSLKLKLNGSLQMLSVSTIYTFLKW
jgi:hypothetical protein